MNRYLRFNKKCKLALLLLLSVAGMGKGYASYDFVAFCGTGQALYYKITDATNHYVKVSFPSNDASYPWSGIMKPTGAVIIPSVVTNEGVEYTVSSIGMSAFYTCSGLTSIEIPNSVLIIDNYAFRDCTGLTSASLGNSVSSIGNYAFKGCSGLTSVVLPNSMTYIGNDSFSGCSKLTSIEIPDSVISIGGYAFAGCSKLTSAILGNSLTSIGNYAFSGCTKLASVILGNSLTTIGNYAFSNCSGLTSIELPNSVTTIGDYVFNHCNGMTSVLIGNSVSTIGNYAFYYCNKLTSVEIPNSVSSIGDGAFSDCGLLTTVIIGNSVVSIGAGAFSSCFNLASVFFGNSVTSIGDYAFSNCCGLTSVTIPNSVTTIGSSAFSNCSGLTSMTIPNSVTSIGNMAFSGCIGVENIVVDSENTVFDSRNNCNAIIKSNTNELVVGCKNTVIPNTVTSIGYAAFFDCSSLTSIEIPSSVTTIGSYSFSECSGLTFMTVLADTPILLGTNVFRSVPKSIPVYVPCGSKSSYQAAEGWSSFTNYHGIDGFSIMVSTNLSEGGSADGGGNYCSGEICTLTASPNDGYTFVNWTKNGNVVSTNETYTFTVTGSVNYIANFEEEITTCNIVFSLMDSYGDGWEDGYLVVNYGGFTEQLTIDDGHSASYTLEIPDGSLVGLSWISGETDEECTFTICYENGNMIYYGSDLDIGFSASFVVSCDETPVSAFYITTTASPITGGVVSGAGIYNQGEVVSLTAIPNTGYSFVDWKKGSQVVSTNPSFSFTATETASYTATFSLNSYEITAIANPIEGGTITGAGMYDEGTAVSLTATPAEGYTFVNWTENGEEVSTDATYSFTVTGDRTLVANFSEIPPDNHWTSITGTQYNLTMSGVIYIDGVAQTSTALEIGAFCGDECRGSARAQYFPLTNEYVVSLTVVSNQQNGETITFRLYDHDTQQEFPSECVNSITFVANANFGEMGNWYSFAFNHAVAVTATVTPEGAGEVEGVGDYLIGTTCTLTAMANTGYSFVNWTENSEVVSTDNPYTFTVNDAVELTANFSLNSYDITASANPTEGGTVSGTGTYDHFSSCTLTATANTGYSFVNWTLDGIVVSTEAEFTFEVGGAGDYVANFSLNSYEITAIANPTVGGTISGTGTYNHFSFCTLTATANTGYAFHSWSVAGEVVSTDNPYTFTVSGGVEVTANFDAQQATALAEGWTWWSTSIELSDIDGLTMLEESLGHNGLMIKSANKFVQNYYPSTGYDYWFGQLTSDDFTNASSYMIQTSASCEVTMTGTYADPSNHPIQLYPGWTWIGYPCGTEQSAASAFMNFTPTANDKVKSQYAFSTYYDNYGWFPEFTMTPGEGYLYQSLASDTRMLTFANGSKDNPQPAYEEDRYWRNNIHAYADNMNVIAVVTIDGEEQQGEDLELCAFVAGECRGSAVLKHFQPTDRWYAMLTVTGTDGDQIEFCIIDKGKGQTSMTSDRSLAFQANAVVGELDEPYTIGFGTLGCVENNLMGAMHIYPNPIDRNTAFSIVIPETETVRSIYIVNMMGEVVAHETNLARSLSLQAQGIYTIKVVCQSGNVFVGKLIVK